MKRTVTILLFIFAFLYYSGVTVNAQKNNIWYFGAQSGLDFNASPAPVATGNSVMIADEGCSSICDDNGRLLFYTNGVTVYNRNHTEMLNGSSIGGNISAFQSGIIVPYPGNPNLYYIFTSDAIENSYANGYRYSVVDMAGDNGNGAVTSKNNLLIAPGTERLAACRHANGTDVWVITNDHNSNTFRAWLVNCSGIQYAAVVSSVGEIMNQHESMGVGAIRISPDGKQICQTHFPDLTVPGGNNFFQIFDFDNLTGIISNPKKISVPGINYINGEYAPNSQLFYAVRLNAADQFQIRLASAANIISSRISLSSSNNLFGAQLAPDGKIYLSPTGLALDVINNPDVAGTGCNYRIAQQPLLKPAMLGFPAFVNDASVSPYNGFMVQILDSCTGRVQFSGQSNLSGILSWQWDFGDGNTSALQNPVHTFVPARNNYTVTLKITSSVACNGAIAKMKTVSPTGSVFSKPDFRYFGGCDSGYIRFEIINPVDTNSARKYTWYFDDGTSSEELNPKHIYNQPGVYNVKLKIKTTTACLDDSTTKAVDMADLTGTASISPDQVIFAGQTIKLFATGPGTHFEWSPASGLDNPFIASPKASPLTTTTYKVRISTDVGCFVERSVKLTVVELDDIYVPTGFTPNNDGKNDLLIPLMASKYSLKEFSVYNRWGQRVYTTATTGEGWNGKQNGIVNDSGVYIWVLKAADEAGKLIEKKGTVMLIQ